MQEVNKAFFGIDSVEEVMARVKQMEQYMDDVSEILEKSPESIKDNERGFSF